MDNRKELKKLYQNRTIVGGVYRIACGESGGAWLKATKNLQEQKNRFQFFAATNGCPEPAMRAAWERYGAGAFSFEVLEELEKKETQSEAEYARDIETLLELWRGKLEEPQGN